VDRRTGGGVTLWGGGSRRPRQSGCCRFSHSERPGTQFTCFTGTKVRILTPEELQTRTKLVSAICRAAAARTGGGVSRSGGGGAAADLSARARDSLESTPRALGASSSNSRASESARTRSAGPATATQEPSGARGPAPLARLQTLPAGEVVKLVTYTYI
jgi:hypothetical protein